MAKYPKKPKAPKGGLAKASVKQLENYNKKLDEWNKKCREVDSNEKKRDSLRKTVEKKASK